MRSVRQALGDAVITTLWIVVLVLFFGAAGALILALLLLSRLLWAMVHCP